MAFYKSTAVVTSIERNSDGKWVMFAQSEKDGRLNLSEKVNKINSFPYEICHIGDIVEYGHWNDGSVAPISNITYNSNKKIRNFINQEKQDAVVTGCIQIPNTITTPKTFVTCWSPVWKEIEFTTNRIDIQRGDRLTLTRTKKENTSQYYYYVKENHSVNEIIQNVGINEILKDFDKKEQNKLLLIADRIRLGLQK